ncbi:MAG: hypothetical protein EB141_15825, partial [Verrucomicrobia bacterium]|nr:hypothetical protein [Verrucomicrobiota bacterium]
YTPDGRPDRTGSGALIGGASGAMIGSIADRRHPGVGALIGGAAGALTGGLIGHSMDQQERARYRPVPPPPPAPNPPAPAVASNPTSLEDIKNMSKAGVSDEVIINQIVTSRSVYQLSADAIVDLNRAGVSAKVINYMIGTPGTAAAAAPLGTTVTQAPPPPRVETVYVSPGPDYVWVNGEWVWYRGSWVWVSGRWVYPPRPRVVWVEARWVNGPGGYHHHPGYWR